MFIEKIVFLLPSLTPHFPYSIYILCTFATLEFKKNRSHKNKHLSEQKILPVGCAFGDCMGEKYANTGERKDVDFFKV